jgi:hypothetical protein
MNKRVDRVAKAREKLGIPAANANPVNGRFDAFPPVFFEALGYEIRYRVHVDQATPYYALTRERFWRWMHLSIFNPQPAIPKLPYPLPASQIPEWLEKQRTKKLH